MSPSIQPLFRAQHDPDRLPTPTQPRYTLLRIGIQNVWEYDVTTRFVARDGRLLLRGQNESGKTKAVEVSLPAVLDAILRAERLDPFGEQARTMRENLIGPHTDEDATVVAGYVWAEFGRLDEHGQPRYQTAGYGVRASATLPGSPPGSSSPTCAPTSIFTCSLTVGRAASESWTRCWVRTGKCSVAMATTSRR